ncbi:tol-pal system protein YbgF [Piscinibacter sakaiensis]|nr:tol-pal system protein YbgF [Piscinibacter sakaiensis]
MGGLLVAAAALASLPAHAGLFDDDEARRAILDLRTRLDQLSEQARARDTERAGQIAQQQTALTEQLTQLRRSLLDLNNQLDLLRADNAKLRGQNEQLARDVAELQRGQKDLRQGVDDRLRQFEPQKVSVDGQEISVDPEEKRLYDAAMAQIRASDFAGAVAGLQAFQRRYPASGYNESVLYWLGNAQYARRDCKEATTSFRSLVASAPGHPRAPEALLSIANCQSEQKDTRGARRTLDELVKTYPNSEAAVAARERLAALK